MFTTGQRFSRYTILEELGHGGMGWVFKAVDPERNLVALKILDLSMDFDHTFVQRFQREVEICSLLCHPHIVPFREAGECGGLQFMALRFIEGETLEDRLARDGALPPDEAAYIARCVAEALDYAASHHIIHRDVKPANILLASEGGVYVTDFGIARAEGAMAFTRPGSAMGTPAYMSPEEVSGETVDHRHDVYSLGIVLYEMIVGRPPFQGRNPLEIIHRHVDEKPQPIRQQRPDVPRWLEAVVMKALVKNRDARYQTCGELARALADGAAAEESEAGATQAPQRGRESGVSARNLIPSASWARQIAGDPSRALTYVLAAMLALLFVLVVVLTALVFREMYRLPLPSERGSLIVPAVRREAPALNQGCFGLSSTGGTVHPYISSTV